MVHQVKKHDNMKKWMLNFSKDINRVENGEVFTEWLSKVDDSVVQLIKDQETGNGKTIYCLKIDGEDGGCYYSLPKVRREAVDWMLM